MNAPFVALAGIALAGSPAADLHRLQGEWLIDTASGMTGWLAAWEQRFAVRGTTATSVRPGVPPASTRLVLQPDARPRRVSWEVEGYGLFGLWLEKAVPRLLPTYDPVRFALWRACGGYWVRGVYDFDGDAVRVCLAVSPYQPWPNRLDPDPNASYLTARLRRWLGRPAEPFTGGTVRAVDTAGRPVPGAVVTRLTRKERPDPLGITGADGTAVVAKPYDALVAVHQPDRGLMAFTRPTPAGLHHGHAVTLAPAARVTGRLTCPDLSPELDLRDYARVVLTPVGGPDRTPVAWLRPTAGRLDFPLPPGAYTIGVDLPTGSWTNRTVTVRPGQAAVDLGDLTVRCHGWLAGIGKPAPPFPDKTGWVGRPAPLADLRGSVVMVHLSGIGYADLATTADRHRAKGLRVVAVDPSGARTAAEFVAARAKNPLHPPDPWGRQPPPFPVALAPPDARDWVNALDPPELARHNGGVLIDRAGRVRGCYYATDHFAGDGPPDGQRVFYTMVCATSHTEALAQDLEWGRRPPAKPSLLETLLAE